MHVLAELTPLDPTDGSRPVLRVCSDGRDSDLAGHDGQEWWPAITEKPKLSITLFDGDFTGNVRVSQAEMTVLLDVLAQADADAARYVWAGAGVTVWTWAGGTASQVFVGKVSRFGSEKIALKLVVEVDTEPFDADVLSLEYAGTTGVEGGADLKGRVKPWLFGRAKNVEPVLIDAVNYVYQVSAYGAIAAVSAVYERGSAFGASSGDYADYASLVAASLPEGAWATCLGSGLIRLGAPAYGVITVDADGDNFGSTFRRKTGEIISRIATALSIDAGLVLSSSLTALDAAVPYNINLYLTDQISFYDLVVALARPCNAVAGIDFLGRIFVSRIVFGTASITLDVQGRSWPPVAGATEQPVQPPYKRIVFGADRSWRVHSFDEIAFYAPLVDMGLYSATTIYREGNIVNLSDGSRWLYVNTTPSAGNEPAAGSAYWAPLYGISTTRYPVAAPSGPVLGSLYFGADNHPYRWEGTELTFEGEVVTFEGEAITVPGWVSVQDKSLLQLIEELQQVDDDGILTIDEKIRTVIPNDAALEAKYQAILAQATSSGMTITDTTTARTAWITLRNSLSPAWNDTTEATAIIRADWDSTLETYKTELEDANSLLSGAAAVSVVAPEAQTVEVDASGAPVSGQYPRTLTPTVKRAAADIRDDDDVSYSIATSGITATVNNTAGSADKGKITATAGTSGYVDLTVTVASVAHGPFRILFTRTGVNEGSSTSMATLLPDGRVLTVRQHTAAANTAGTGGEKLAYGGGYVYSSYVHAWVSGGEGGSGAQDNNPYVDYGNGGEELDGCNISSARDVSVTIKLYAIGE